MGRNALRYQSGRDALLPANNSSTLNVDDKHRNSWAVPYNKDLRKSHTAAGRSRPSNWPNWIYYDPD